MKNKQIIENNLKHLRKALKLTTEEAAEKTGLSVGTINKLENGGMNLTHKYIRIFAVAYHVPQNDITSTTEGGWKGEIPAANLWKIVETVIELARDHPQMQVKDFIAIAKALQRQEDGEKPLNMRNMRREAERLVAYEMARN